MRQRLSLNYDQVVSPARAGMQTIPHPSIDDQPLALLVRLNRLL
ncbi:hypothetical protein [Amphritea sp.]